MPEDIKIGLGADVSDLLKGIEQAKDKIRSFGKAVNAANPDTDSFRKIQQQLERQGIKTTAAIESQIVEFRNLQKVFGQDAVAAAEIEKRLKSLNDELERVNSSVSSAIPPFNALTNAQSTLARIGVVTSESIEKQIAQLERLKITFKDDATVVAQLNARIDRLNQSLQGGRGLTGSSGQATNALTNLNRVVQDAPFGFLAISNNIDPLIFSFQQLQKSTGGGKAALQALLTALSGPAGLLFAVSTATSLFIAFGDNIKAAFAKGKKAAEDAKKAFKDVLDDVISIQTGSGRVEFKTLAQVEEGVDRIETEIKQAQSLLAGFEKELSQGRFGAGRPGLVGPGAAPAFDSSADSLGELNENIENTKTRIEKLEEVLAVLRAGAEKFKVSDDLSSILGGLGTPEFSKFPEVPLPATILPPEPVDPNDAKFRLGPLPNIAENFNDPIAEATTNLLNFEKAVNTGLVTGVEAAQQRINLLTTRLRVMIAEGVNPASSIFRELQADLNVAQSEFDSLNKSIEVNQIAFDIFTDAGGQLLDSLLDKTQSLGDALRNVGRQLLSFGLNLGLSAVGKALFPGIDGLIPLASGGIVRGPTPALIGEAGPEAVIPLDKLGSVGAPRKFEVKALRISGGDLLLGLQEANSTRGVGGVIID